MNDLKSKRKGDLLDQNGKAREARLSETKRKGLLVVGQKRGKKECLGRLQELEGAGNTTIQN